MALRKPVNQHDRWIIRIAKLFHGKSNSVLSFHKALDTAKVIAVSWNGCGLG